MLGGMLKGFWKSSQKVAQGFWNTVDKVDGKAVSYSAQRTWNRTKRVGRWADRKSSKMQDRWMGVGRAGNPNAGTAMAPYSRGRAMFGAATAPFARNPTATKAAAITGAGVYGYATGEGSTGQRIERGLGFAAGMGLGATQAGRKLAKSAFGFGKVKPSAATGMVPYSRTGATMSGFRYSLTSMHGLGVETAAGALYGAIDEETTILGGAASGAAIGLGANVLTRGAMRGWAKGHRVGARTFAAGGGAIGLVAGGPVGMAVGAGIGGTIGGAARFARKYPTAAKYAAGTALVGGMSTAIVGSSAANAYEMHQRPRNTNYGADGDLALGLHALRHG